MSTPTLAAHRWIFASHPGAASISWRKPVTTAGTISTSSSTTTAIVSTKMSPVAAPRRHPCEANQFTAGSMANERNSDRNRIWRKLES